MAKYILQILRTKPMVVLSWGFHNPQRLPNNNGLKFQVQGFKYQGSVEVIYIEGKDLFEVVLTDNGRRVEDVYLDSLINVIDGLVERVDNYKERVLTEYGKKKKHLQSI